MALAFIVLSLVLYSYDDDYYSVADGTTWTEFEIIWRPVHDYEMIYIQQWEVFMYLHVSDLVHCNAMYNDNCLYYLAAWELFTSTFWRMLSPQIKDDIRRFREFSLIEKMRHQCDG